MFDRKKFLREIRALSFIALFIFLLGAVNLSAKTNEQILSACTMEMAGYTGICDEHYGELGDAGAEQLKQAMASLENDPSTTYLRQYFILDRSTGEILATGEVPDRVREELEAQVNENTILIDGQSCKVVDFDHYKLLMRMKALPSCDEYVDAVAGYALAVLCTLLVAFALVALGQRIAGRRETLRAGINVVLTLAIVGSFAFEVFQAETAQLDYIAAAEQETLQQDLEYLCNESSVAQQAGKEEIEMLGNSIARASVTLGGVAYTGSATRATDASDAAPLVASRDVEIWQDEGKLQNERTGFYIQAALLLLLAFILAKEVRDYAVAEAKAKTAGAADLTADDRKIRTVMMLVGLATSCFGIVNVLRIRQVVMANWTGDVAGIIGGVFTATMIVGAVGSLVSSSILRRCGSVRSYVVVVCGLGVLGSVVCGISNNAVVFVAGLLVYSIAQTTSLMSNDFYATLIDDAGRKDLCNVEFTGSKMIGDVVGTIAGGIVSMVVSFAFVQVMVAVIFLATAAYAWRMSGTALPAGAESGDGKQESMRESLLAALKAARRPNVALFMLLISLTGAIPYMLVQYKLPLDIAALGLSTVVLSFVKTLQQTVEIYVRPLFHVVNRRIGSVTHAVLYEVLCGVVVLMYMAGGTSVPAIAVALALLGLLDGAGNYAITKAFRELPDLSDVPESDRIVTLRLSQTAGDAIAPSLLSVFSSGPVLPVATMVLPSLYWVRDKLSRKKRLAGSTARPAALPQGADDEQQREERAAETTKSPQDL